MPGFELLVELVRPGPATRAVEGGFIEERRINRFAKMFAEPIVVGLVRDLDEPVGGVRIQVIADGITILYAHKSHDFPRAGGHRPIEAPLAHGVRQLQTLQCRSVHRHEGGELTRREVRLEPRRTRDLPFVLVQPFDRQLRPPLRKETRVARVLRTRRTAREAVFIVERQGQPE